MLASSPPPLPTGEISPPSPPAPTGEWSPALAAAAAPRARARRHPYLFARVAAPRFPIAVHPRNPPPSPPPNTPPAANWRPRSPRPSGLPRAPSQGPSRDPGLQCPG
ncbi:uncharacterized protein N7506_012419 [Penicillium brevicompactum]|uniref:uncharacterized protein n=1 Tax=Penicillium brevicompactum TaxID=5074 RepID=UPI00254226A0|nr:uncharacterized protein N7506_012419 [Penicillium brevicompactum]KAJ5319715.1 hypothetical protein N7506_012419 [Penicillium brevicompactum]